MFLLFYFHVFIRSFIYSGIKESLLLEQETDTQVVFFDGVSLLREAPGGDRSAGGQWQGWCQVLGPPDLREMVLFVFVFFKVYFIDYAITDVPVFPLCPPLPGAPLPSSSLPPYFMSMGHACKFFAFSIAYTVLNSPLFILYLPNDASKSLYLFPHSPPSPSQLITLQMISISMFLFLF